MVKVVVDWERRELTAEGHAQADLRDGLDPVCLAVSTVVFALEDEMKILDLTACLKELEIEGKEKGRYRIRAMPKRGAESVVDSMLTMTVRAVKILATEFPENVQVETRSIRIYPVMDEEED